MSRKQHNDQGEAQEPDAAPEPTNKEFAATSLRKIVDAGITQNNAEGWIAATRAAEALLNAD